MNIKNSQKSKRLLKLPKRLKIVITVLLSVIPTFVLIQGNENTVLLSTFISSLIVYVGMYWVLEFQVKKIGFFTYMFFPSLFAFPFLYILNDYIRFLKNFSAFGLVFGIIVLIYIASIYAIALSSNILNVATISKIPLVQAAHTIVFVFTFLSGYLYFNIFSSFGLHWTLYSISVFIIALVLLFQALSAIVDNIREAILLSLVGAFIIFQLSIVLLSWRLEGAISALVFTVVLYIYQGIILHENKNSFSSGVKFEYLLLGIIVLMIMIFSAEWGIAGRLI